MDFSPMSWLPLLPGAFYLISSGRYRARDVAAMALALFAASRFLDGAYFLFQANDRWEQGRDLGTSLSDALVQLTLAAVLGLPAGFLSGWLRRATPKYLTVPGVVTSVQSLEAGGKMHWRVGFAYSAANGTAYEGVDEIYVAGPKPHDACTVVYPPEQPDLGTLRSTTPAASEALPSAIPSLEGGTR